VRFILLILINQHGHNSTSFKEGRHRSFQNGDDNFNSLEFRLMKRKIVLFLFKPRPWALCPKLIVLLKRHNSPTSTNYKKKKTVSNISFTSIESPKGKASPLMGSKIGVTIIDLIRQVNLTWSDLTWFENKWVEYEFNFFDSNRVGLGRINPTWPD
jgi:hypothetical protein